MNPSRQRRLRLLAKIVPVVVTLVICLLGIEIFARVIYGRPTMHFGLEMWKYAKDLKMPVSDPGMAFYHRPNSEAFLMGADMKSNPLGMRNQEITTNKPPGTCRVIVLGDSTTVGWGVHFEKTYPYLLQQSFNANPPSGRWQKYEVINTGIGNYNTAMEVASLKDRWLKLDPDMVLIGWYINDAEPTPRPREPWLALHSYGYVWLTSQFGNLVRNVGANKNYKDYYDSLYDPNQPGWPKCQAAFADLARVCRERNIPLKILLIPELHSLSGNYEFTHIHDLIRNIGATNDVEVLDLINAFPPSGDPKQFWASPEDAHPNDPANELMAARIDEVARKEQWLK